MNSSNVFGLGDPVTDIIVGITDEFLDSMEFEPGGSIFICPDDNAVLLSRLNDTGADITSKPGGSAANVLTCYSNMNRSRDTQWCAILRTPRRTVFFHLEFSAVGSTFSQ